MGQVEQLNMFDLKTKLAELYEKSIEANELNLALNVLHLMASVEDSQCK